MQFLAITAALVTVLQVQDACGHVLLTYPPARNPKYDYIDNYRKGGPCGVADDPNGHVTTLQAGSTFNVTYTLSYPHRGGIRLNLLNSTGHVLFALLGLQEPFVNSEDITLEHHEVVLPLDFVCQRCVLQIARQAQEFSWTNSVFRSCADIAIVNSTDAVCDNMTCSGHGTCVNGKCNCDRLFSGEICQNEEECEDESDCNGQGSCIDIQSTDSPTKRCFCNRGWFGEKCARSSSLTDATINPNNYPIVRELHSKLTLYAKIDENELEVALKHNGTSYVAVGWKPTEGVERQCNNEIPRYMPVGSHHLWPFPLSLPLAENADAFYNSLEGINSTYTPPRDEQGNGGWAGLHPMDCTDIVIGMARGDQFRVFDYFTRDRGKPQRDDFYNGVESLSAAVGMEEDGFTHIKWRRPLVTGDAAADYNIENKEMVLIWAYGQVSPEYSHLFLNREEFTLAQNQRFFPVDELKYHGNKNRGMTTVNFFEMDEVTTTTMTASASTVRNSDLLLMAIVFLVTLLC